MIHNVSCMLIDVINNTLATCNYENCTKECMNYLIEVVNQCPHVFNNETYTQLWLTLYRICGH